MRPKIPCTRDCPDRQRITASGKSCHSELCPHGWTEYEKAHKAEYAERSRRNQSDIEITNYKVNSIGKTIKRLNGK